MDTHPSETFTVSFAWNQFRPKMPVVSWHHAIWFPQAIRRHAFIVWLAIQDRLATQDKILKWGLTNFVSCVFCQASVEDRNHLFFGCQFTAGIWLRILKLCGISRMPRNWENEFLWLISTKGVIGIVEYMRTSFLLPMIFFTSFVMMLDCVSLVFRRSLIIQ